MMKQSHPLHHNQQINPNKEIMHIVRQSKTKETPTKVDGP